jgi:L-ornithine N5-oxygenase
MEQRTVDVLGIGFGPANLALAIALREAGGDDAPRCVFVDEKPGFSWHPGMLIPGSRAQVPFFKDLVTLRDPTSRFSYLKWLHDRGLLLSFVTARDITPYREELDAYFRWAASHFSEVVRYGHRVVCLQPDLPNDDGRVGYVRALIRELGTGREFEVLARGVVLATGGAPRLPQCAEEAQGSRVFHSSRLLPSLEATFPDRSQPYHFVVVGAGQSAGDAACYLLSAYPECQVTIGFRGFAMRPLDETPFVNEIFLPEGRDLVRRLSPEQRRELLDDHRHANYAAVDAALLQEMYRQRLTDRILGRQRLRVLPFHELAGVDADDYGVRVEWRETTSGLTSSTSADGVVLGTGYQRVPSLLAGLRPYVVADDDLGVEVGERYRVRTTPDFEPGVFVQGFAEETHGLSDTLLSLVSVRAGEIAQELLSLTPVPPTPVPPTPAAPAPATPTPARVPSRVRL